MGQVGAFETDEPGGDSYMSDGQYMRKLEEREFDLRVKMFALDMAVQSLPSVLGGIEIFDLKMEIVRNTAAEYEKILRGEN